MRLSIKPYAYCRCNHGLIDRVRARRNEQEIRPEETTAVRLGVLSGGAVLVAGPIEQKRTPTTLVGMQFSAPFAAALAAVHGTAGLAELSHDSVEDPLIRSLMARTDCYRDPSLDAGYPARWPAAAEIRLKNGRSRRGSTTRPPSQRIRSRAMR